MQCKCKLILIDNLFIQAMNTVPKTTTVQEDA